MLCNQVVLHCIMIIFSSYRYEEFKSMALLVKSAIQNCGQALISMISDLFDVQIVSLFFF